MRARIWAIVAALMVTTGILVPVAASASAQAPVPPRCLSQNLHVYFLPDFGGGYAGGYGYNVLWENMGRGSCSLTGYPGISALGSKLRVLGSPAGRDPIDPVATVTMPPGGIVVSKLLITDVLAYPKAKCKPAPAFYIRAYAPGAYQADRAKASFEACRAPGIVYMSTGTVIP